MKLLKTKIYIIVLGFIFIGYFNTSKAATIYFNVVYTGTVNTNSIATISNVAGSGFSFTSSNPNDAVFITTGNDVSGTVSYINSSDQVISMSGIISRQNKSGSITNGLFFYPTSNPTVGYILVIPGRESQFTSGQSYGSSSDTGNTVTMMNEILTTQETQPVLRINSPTAVEGSTYLLFEISFTNNEERTGESTFNLSSNSGSALLDFDFTSAIQYSFDQLTWANVSGSISFPISEDSMYIRVPLLNDTIKECTESMTLEAGSISGGNVLNNGGAFGIGTIYDLEDYYVWLGGISTAWNNAENWMCGDIPISGGNVVISSAASNDLILGQDRNIGYLKFSDAGKKVKPNTSILTVTIIYNANGFNYIQTTDIGKLNMQIAIAEEKLFPVGNSSFNPLVIGNNSNSDDYFTVRVLDEVFANGYDGSVYNNPRVARTWDISKATVNNGNGIDLTFNWNAGEEVNLLNPKMLHHNGNVWEAPVGQQLSAQNTFTFYNYTGTFSPFAISDGGTAMAVSLNYFNMHCDENSHALYWQTQTETNSDKYIIEVSTDGYIWEKLDELKAAGESTEIQNYEYEVWDFRQNKYYRLIQTDFDGKATTYGPITSSCNFEKMEVTIYPNPSDGDFYIKFDSPKQESYSVKFKSMDGKVLKEEQIQVKAGTNIIPMTLMGFIGGNYVLSISNEDSAQFQNFVVR